MPTPQEFFNEVQRMINTEELPEGISSWFAYCGALAITKGNDIKDVEKSFLESQPDVAESVRTTFAWLSKLLE